MPKLDHTVIFVHMPKAAGTTLYRIMERNYAKAHIYTFWTDGTIKEFKQLSAARKAQIHLLRGHAGYGMHAYLPGPCRYFTVLRDPTKRTLSHFEYVCRMPQHYCYDFVHANHLTLLQFIESKCDPLSANAQTRLLSGLESGHELPVGFCTTEHLDRAKYNLTQMAAFGLAEDFDRSLLFFAHEFGWKKLAYAPQNVADSRVKNQPVPPEALAAVAEVTQLDTQLYTYARDLFADRVRQLGDSFAAELAEFQAANRRLKPIFQAWWGVREFSVRAYLREWLAQNLR